MHAFVFTILNYVRNFIIGLNGSSHESEIYLGLAEFVLSAQPSASVDNTNLGLDNSRYHAQH